MSPDPDIPSPARSSARSSASQATPSRRLWSGCVARPAREFPPTPLRALSGELPPTLNGTLYRNGPARLERGGARVGHWFDGDGAVLAVRFANGSAQAVYRYVQSNGYRREQAAERLLFGNYGMTAPGPIWNHWRRPLKNAANTSVLALPDRVLALWEGGWPHALDPETLETRGLDDLAGPGGRLGPREPLSAHPKVDPVSGEGWNFGVGIGGRNATLNLYRCDPRGRLVAHASHPLEGVPFIHDYVMAGRWLVFLVPPIRIDALAVLIGLRSYTDAMRWRPQLGTQILIFDRETLELVSRGEAEPWFQWHFGNGSVIGAGAAGSILIDFVRYEDFGTNQHLREVARGHTETPAHGRLWRMRLDPMTARMDELVCLSERSVEFPMVPPGQVGGQWRQTFVAAHRTDTDTTAERYDGLARLDHASGDWAEADLGTGRYPSEPILAPDTDVGNARHWLLSVVYNGHQDSGELWVLDADRIEDGPVCVLALPEVVPLSFHGCWRA